MTIALTNASVFLDGQFRSGVSVVLEEGRVASVIAEGGLDPSYPSEDLEGLRLAPGFIDSQVNGGGGALFNDDLSLETLRTIAAAHRSYGTTGFLPTLISDDLDVVATAIAAVDQAIEEGVPGILGIHLEGPFLSADRAGVHDPAKFLHMAEEHIDIIASLRSGRTLVTLAPEHVSPGLIAQLVERGVVVSAGHTNATHAEMRAAFRVGVTGVTHLFNAMSPLTSREPGVVGAALEDQESWCGVIVDGRHVAPTTLAIAFRAKRLDRFMLVTDAMPSVGTDDKAFSLQGRTITVRNGVCVTEEGVLAGSDLDMASAVRNAAAIPGVGLDAAVAMATRNPATFLGVHGMMGEIVPGGRADLVAFDDDLRVAATWIGGEKYSFADEPELVDG